MFCALDRAGNLTDVRLPAQVYVLRSNSLLNSVAGAIGYIAFRGSFVKVRVLLL